MTPGRRLAWRQPLIAAVVLVLLSLLAVETPDRASSGEVGAGSLGPGGRPGASGDAAVGGDANGNPGEPGSVTGDGAGQPGATDGSTGGTPGAAGDGGFSCAAGDNGGATDVGVTADRIRLAATNVRSGVGSSFLGSAFIGMQAVVNRVNAAGGICGRLLDLRLVDDGWDAARGAGFIQNFASEGYFALPVVPSSEGLTQAILNGTISGAGIPVIGSDGMLKEQYGDPFVWPVATATVSTMRIMVNHAYQAGARSFGIVYDQRYRFGAEGAEAFRQFVGTLAGASVAAYVGITPEQNSYNAQAQQFVDACGAEGCEFVAMLLDPTTANTYISSHSVRDGRNQGFGTMLTGGAQPLFNERFARDCGRSCDGMLVWTGYNPPIGARSSLADVAAYVDAVRGVDPGVDVNNQFLEGAYLGMEVFVEALRLAGPNLTRVGLAQAIDGMTFESDLSATLQWDPGQRFANQSAQAFRITTASGSFAGFADTGTGFLTDPTPGVVPD